MREARAAAALRHPNVATVYQFGVREETGQFFYAMELVEGETLEDRVRRLGPLDVLTTIDIALQVTAALEAAEERGLVHRDLKPGNLMLVEAAPSPLSSSNDNATRTSHPAEKECDEGVASTREGYRLSPSRQSGGGENERDGSHPWRLRGDTGICQSGTIYECACRRALRHLLVRRDALVLADRSHAFHPRRLRRFNRRVDQSLCQSTSSKLRAFPGVSFHYSCRCWRLNLRRDPLAHVNSVRDYKPFALRLRAEAKPRADLRLPRQLLPSRQFLLSAYSIDPQRR